MNEDDLLYAAAATAALILVASHEKKPKRRCWMKNLARPRTTYSASNPMLKELKIDGIVQFSDNLQMRTTDYEELLKLVSPKIFREDTFMREAISTTDRLNVTLRFLAGGGNYSDLYKEFGIPKSTLCKMVPEVCDALQEVLKCYIKTPSTREEWKVIAQDFETKWNMPHCLGAVDGKHIAYNFKGIRSTVVMAVADADCNFIIVNEGCNGTESDVDAFANSRLHYELVSDSLNFPEAECLPHSQTAASYFFVCGTSLPLQDRLLKPYSGWSLTYNQHIFNYRLLRAHRVIENAFGIMTSRFKILLAPIILCPEKVDKIVQACCSLHNYFRRSSSRDLYSPSDLADREDDDHKILPGLWRKEVTTLETLETQLEFDVLSEDGKTVRDTVCNYVNTQGSIPYQSQSMLDFESSWDTDFVS